MAPQIFKKLYQTNATKFNRILRSDNATHMNIRIESLINDTGTYCNFNYEIRAFVWGLHEINNDN